MSAALTRSAIHGAAALLLCLGGVNAVQAQKPAGLPGNYPNKPVKVIVGASAGGGADFLARLMTSKVSEDWGSQFVVENMPSGMGGIIGLQFLRKSSPDGYTLGNTSGSTFQNAMFSAKLDFDVRKAFVPIAQVSSTALYLAIHPQAPFTNLKELIAYAKENPGKLNYAAGGTGGGNHLASTYFMDLAGIKMTHIPYKGAGQSTIDAMAGRVLVIFASSTSLTPLVKAGKLRGIGNTAAQRMSTQPDVPTIAEQGVPGFSYESWIGWVGPTGIPDPIVRALNAEVNKVLERPEIIKIMVDEGASPRPGTPEQFRKTTVDILATIEGIIKKTGIQLTGE